MTFKTVLVKAPHERNFKVSFERKDDQTDFTAFKEAFYKVCANDFDFKNIILNEEYSRLSFRKYDEDFRCNIELTDFEEIINGSTIELFVSTPAVFDISLQSAESVNSIFSENNSHDWNYSLDNIVPPSNSECVPDSVYAAATSLQRIKKFKVSTYFS